MYEIIRNIAAVIFVFGMLVFVHELGHFVVAKLNGMYVYQFCLGLGPKILKYQGKETTYAICLLPIGGMVDLREDDSDPTDARSFASKKPWQRLAVIVAGAFMNFVLAYILMVGIYLTLPYSSTTIETVIEEMPAAEAGLQSGDVIKNINGDDIKVWTDITSSIGRSEDSSFLVTIEREGQLLEFEMIGEMIEGSYKIGISPTMEKNPSVAFKFAWHDFLDKSTLIFDGFKQLVTGKIEADQVSGPVGIFKQVVEVAEQNDLRNLLYFSALLSINLGILNLMPFPFLDGGRAVFILYELIMRKPINKDKEAFVHFLGMVALMVLMVVLVFKDLS